jgi:hypothetical protein
MNTTLNEYTQRLRKDLPPPLAELAVSRLDPAYHEFGTYCAPYHYAPLMNGFSWDATSEGWRFWNLIHYFCATGRGELPPIPKGGDT